MHPLDGDGADSVRALIRPAATEYSTRRRDIESKKEPSFLPSDFERRQEEEEEDDFVTQLPIYCIHTQRKRNIKVNGRSLGIGDP